MTDVSQTPAVQRWALLSVSDKTGIVEFARYLAGAGLGLLSTGGTARVLRDAGLDVTEVGDFTGFPEMMDGRVKTLHPSVHGAILARRNDPSHMNAVTDHGLSLIDVVVVNLYPFREAVASGADAQTVIENIDIGGPAMLRAAAKNYDHVLIVTSPDAYQEVIQAVAADGVHGVSPHTRRDLAGAAFAHVAAYDTAVAQWFANGPSSPVSQTDLRYGENPHQSARVIVTEPHQPGAATAEQLQGKALSYNNINDTDAAFELVSEFAPDTCGAHGVAIIKHANPCGVALAAAQEDALRQARACDPVSAFGGIVAVSDTVRPETAAAIVEAFTEVVIAPAFAPAALEIFARKKDLRVLAAGDLANPQRSGDMVRSIAGGQLVQSRDNVTVGPGEVKVVTERAPTDEELRDLLFAFIVAKHVKSNAIVYAKNGATTGIGAGQMSRVDSALTAVRKGADAAATARREGKKLATDNLVTGSVVASDAFFPFADGLIAAADAGVTAVIQPGGSIRDDEVIAAANERGLAMVFTGVRHFRH